MIFNPNLIFYSCIARGTTILAEFSREPNLEALALQCIEKAPFFHSIYSHTVRKRTYTFFITHPFVYFGIFYEDLKKSEVHYFLNRIKYAFEEMINSRSFFSFDNFVPYCFQAQFNSVFEEIMATRLDSLSLSPPVIIDDHNLMGKKTMPESLIEKPSNGLKKKKKRLVCEINGDGGKEMTIEEDIGSSLLMQKNMSQMGERQKAKQIWKMQVWVVLLFDLFVCMVLFAVWLCVCRGFQCIDR